MSKLTFYVQARADGGRRMGIDIDDESVLGRFEPGGGEFDPALLWYVDVRCKGELPLEAEQSRGWLLRQSELLKGELKELGRELEVGLDSGLWPLQRKVENAPPSVEIAIVCSSLHRLASRDFGKILGRLADEFTTMVNSLGSVEATA
jgi:hypothetical protein